MPRSDTSPRPRSFRLSTPIGVAAVLLVFGAVALAPAPRARGEEPPTVQAAEPPETLLLPAHPQKGAGAPTSPEGAVPPAATGEAPPDSQPSRTHQATRVDVTVGTSVILDLPGPPQRASVTNPEIANIQIVPPNQILVNGKAPGVTTLIAWVNDKQEYFDIVVTLNLSLLHHAIKQIAPREEIEVKAVQTSVVLSGTVSNPSLIGKAADLAKAFLPEKAAVVNLLQLSEPHQVLLKVEIAEVNRSALREIGLDFINLGTTVAVAVLGATHGGLLATTFNRKEDVVTVDQRVSAAVIHDPSRTRLLFRALEEKGFLKSLARPNLIAASGASASFLVGGEFPVPVPSGVGVGGGVLVTILFKPFGIRLDFTPTLNDFGSVNLKISPEVSDLDFTNAVTITGFQIPALRTRRANTIVDLKPGQSLAIGGLISSEDRKTLSKFPILGDIPVLGALFRSTNFIRNETDLVILVTPEIVKPLAAGQVPNLEEQMAPTTEEERAIRQIPLY